MGYRGKQAPGAKLAFAALVSAALARIALSRGDPVGLSFFGGTSATHSVPVASGRESFERLLAALETSEAGGDAIKDASVLDRGLGSIARSARRGSIVVVLSDLLDLPREAPDRVAAVASRGRVVVVVQTLDLDELTLPFDGTMRLRSLEGDVIVETDADAAREKYLEALDELNRTWERALVVRGARIVRATTSDDPIRVVRSILEAAY